MPPRVQPSRPGDRHLPRGCPEVPGGKVRVPESLLPRYVQLKNLLGSNAGHADVFRFLFETARSRIDEMVREILIEEEVLGDDTTRHQSETGLDVAARPFVTQLRLCINLT
ncbi:hypothetical protein R1sor_007364 [Riccia sorocarpa]|uniref:Uncharacterized protein n=1 Tax=Riccia sorocarpa TaxID=122646 RepID=A0ABD3HQK2_9MARC